MLTIRKTSAEDWRALKAVRLAALRDAPDAFGLSLATALAYSDEDWRVRAAGGRAEYFLAFGGSTAAGMIGAHAAGGEYELIAMWVAHSLRGTPAARLLVDAVKAAARAQGHRRIVLAVAPGNGRAAAFYKRQGFDWLDSRHPLDSNPAILLRKMAWHDPAITISGEHNG